MAAPTVSPPLSTSPTATAEVEESKEDTLVTGSTDDINRSKFKDVRSFKQSKIEQAHSEEVTTLLFSGQPSGTKIISAGMDGFIKLHDEDLQTNKSFFVSQAGLSCGCQMGTPDLFALASLNNNVYLFSFYTGTCI